jgi:spore maturation protein CgeB
MGWDGIGLRETTRFKVCDMMISCSDDILKHYRKEGFKTALFQFGFESSILDSIDISSKKYNISFAGSLTLRKNGHHNRLKLLGKVARNFKVDYWLSSFAESKPYLFKNILLKIKEGHWEDVMDVIRLWQINKGSLFGMAMYQAMAYSHITLNSHLDTAILLGGNIRLWESTGVGTCLVTDWKENIDELFVPDKEVVVYRSPEECVDKIRYLLANPTKMEAIAKAGQKRTLDDYSYEKRIKDFIPHLLS